MSRTWSVDEHLADVLRSVGPLEPIELHLLDAQGCVLTEDVLVPVSLPPFDNSSMDGYACASPTWRRRARTPRRCWRSSATRTA